MKDYIEREKVFELLRKWADGYSYIEMETASAIRSITAIPAADVKPVVRGKWIYLGFRSEKYAHPESFYIRCPFCGHEEYVLLFEPRVCRACGAELELKMLGRGDGDDQH